MLKAALSNILKKMYLKISEPSTMKILNDNSIYYRRSMEIVVLKEFHQIDQFLWTNYLFNSYPNDVFTEDNLGGGIRTPFFR